MSWIMKFFTNLKECPKSVIKFESPNKKEIIVEYL